MENEKISIIVPVYNTELYLKKCIESVLNQTYKNIEIICVNDSSTDNSLQLLNEYAKIDDRIVVITQENEGLSGARNKGLLFVSGQYIMFLDSDDWIDENTCEVALNTLHKHNAQVVFWPYIREFADKSLPKIIFNDDEIVFEGEDCKMKVHRRFVGLLGEELAQVENADAIVTAWGKLYDAGAIQAKNIRFIDTKIIGTEDAIFNFEVFNDVNCAVYINKYFSHYRRDNENSLTTNFKPKLFLQWQNLFLCFEEVIQKNNLGAEYEQALKNRIALSIVGLGINLTNSTKSAKEIRKEIKSIISSEKYREAYLKLTLGYFPIHWKIFFFFAKHNLAFGVYILLRVIQKMRGH